MAIEKILTYLKEFETRVVIEGAVSGMIGASERVSLRSKTKLFLSDFGKTFGSDLDTDEIVVFDLYGLLKKSRGFHALKNIIDSGSFDRSGQVRSIFAPVIHFASIRYEEILHLAPDLIMEFSSIKRALLDLRGFNHDYKP